MTRVLIVAPDLKVGGVQRALVSFLQAAPLEDAAITLRLFSGGGELEREVPSGIRLEIARDAAALESARAGISAFLKKAGLQRTFAAAKALYHRFGKNLAGRSDGDGGDAYDVAIAFSDGLATWYTAKQVQARRKLAFVHTDLRSAGYDKTAEEAVYAGFETIYFGSEAARRSFLSLLPRCAGKTALQPLAVDGAAIRRAAREVPPVEISGEGVRLATVGRLSGEKGVLKIPSLLRRLTEAGQDVRWYVVGDGPEREPLTKAAARLGIADRLILTGTLQNPYSVVARCDVYVQPSDYEGYCLALAEARALRRPCVCCDFSGAREQLQDGETGFITGMEEDALFPKLLKLVEDSDLRRRFSSALIDDGARGYAEFWAQLCPRNTASDS
jgi:glycosyltransferase involved in cell wall biosynthesis